MNRRDNRLKLRRLMSRLFGLALVLVGLFMATTASASTPTLHATDTIEATSPCDEACGADSAEDLCPDDCPDCTQCHSVAPTLLMRITPFQTGALPHSRDSIPVASVTPSNLGQRLFRPPQTI